MQKKKNNHFVPRSYLERFTSISARQICLYNIKRDRVVPAAPIKSQCSRDYFYSTNPVFEDSFSQIEGEQKQLINSVLKRGTLPPAGSAERTALYYGVLLQAGRTASNVSKMDHMSDQFAKAALRHHLERKGDSAHLLELLPDVRIHTTTSALLDSIGQHLAMRPVIDDLDCTLFTNETDEDFLTSDHPIALCNSLPDGHPGERKVGLASRGLIIIYPLSPRALLFLSDAEVYKIAKSGAGVCALKRPKDIVEFNLAQCTAADENLYFATPDRVQATLKAFRQRSSIVRPSLPTLTEATLKGGVLLALEQSVRRFSIPQGVELRLAARNARYQKGDIDVRDHSRLPRNSQKFNAIKLPTIPTKPSD
ncbi:DUF4238 domain-containing protein [Rhizobium sp. BK491]|uniref:DUF4238 domain-containing protein n=1 Tax=Rhizobium sp. BK491 TaxID=2587009 RepID=UPI001608245A|nr:hypothetical protein [Rhizobium sp. BK491]